MPIITIAPKPAPIVVDPVPHVDALHACGKIVRGLLADMIVCRQSLLTMPSYAPLRGVYEDGWESLAIRMHESLRTAYRHLALICTVDPPLGWQTWDTAVGPHADWQQAGLIQLLSYWRGRELPAYQWVDADWRALDKAKIPATFDPDLILTRKAG
jgi:hypothetical protein